jgi:hypothetical protein
MIRLATAPLAAMVGALTACGASTVRRAGPPPTYGGHSVELFDDAIEPRAVGYELDRALPPMNDKLLRERAQVGDAVVRARVTTVTSKDEDRGRSWQIALHSIEKLGGTGPLATDFTVHMDPHGPSAGIMRAFGGRLISMTFIAFVREFADPEAPGESDLHFHLTPDGKADLAAVRAAFTLEQVR